MITDDLGNPIGRCRSCGEADASKFLIRTEFNPVDGLTYRLPGYECLTCRAVTGPSLREHLDMANSLRSG